MINGFVVIDKPAGITSHDVVSRVRRILGTRKVGHTGTLDPFATGVLPVAVNDGTKAIPFLDEGVKCYEAVMQLGVATDTLDMTGSVMREMDWLAVTRERVETVLKQFIGSLNELQYTIDFYLKAVGVTGFFPEGFEATVGGAADNDGDPVAFGVQLTMVSVGGDWVHYQGMFSGVDEFTLIFGFTTPDSNDDNFTVYLDGVSITQVPEPGSLALMALALAGIAVVRRRKA